MSNRNLDGWEKSASLDSVQAPPTLTQRADVGNPYRRPKPRPDEILYQGKFYLANDKGTYGVSTSPVYLVLCRKYLWVSKTLSIPLVAIIDTGLSKKGGYIRYLDSIAGAEFKFNFTKLGIIGFKRKEVEVLLALISQHMPEERLNPVVGTSMPQELENAMNCESCGSADVHAFEFFTLRFIGFAPIAYVYDLTPLRHVLCDEHARRESMRSSWRTALAGYWGFPGFLAAPWYVVRNIWALRRERIADTQTVMLSILGCVIVPWAIIATIIIWVIQSSG